MGHIHTNSGQYDFTASAFIVRTDFKEPKIMLHKHKTFGKYMQFGGHIELSETPWQAIIHEIREEVGYEMSQLKILQPKNNLRVLRGSVMQPMPVLINSHIYPGKSDHYHTDITFALVSNEIPILLPAEGESLDIKVLTLKEVKSLKSEVFGDIVEIAEYVLTNTLREWEMVDISEFSN